VVVTRAVYAHKTVTHDTILGGINVYLLMGFTFQMLHATIMLIDPASYSISGQYLTSYLNADDDIRSFATLLYFSFTTLTTLGYGDILPTSTVARLTTSIEAIFGQLFVAVFIGRLVALEVGRHTAGGAASKTENDDE
jgi:voltage-gated potassium channel Kch